MNPVHIAIIPDGNRRWAKEKGLPTIEGHRRGFSAITKIGDKIRELGIKILTVWAFSTENWNREKEEVDYLMRIYEEWIDQNLKKAIKDKVRIIHLGRKDRINTRLRKKLEDAQEKTKNFSDYYFVIALDYGGRDELLRAIRKSQITNNKSQTLSEKDFEKFLDTRDLPQSNPDMIIRTSGEKRISGFLPWQGAYSEYIFVDKYLPDFTEKDLVDCIQEFKNRKRRFGK